MAIITNEIVSNCKVMAVCLTLILVLFYDYLPKRTINLHPQLTQYIDESVDSDEGGKSQLTWLNKEQFHWVCNLKAGAPYPYCGIAIAWSNQPFKQLDLTYYDALEVNLEYTGQAKYLRMFLRNYYALNDMQDIIGKAKFNNLSKDANAFKNTVTIPFNELRVADWWIDNNQIPPEDIKTDVRNVIAIGLDIPYPNVLGKHEFKLHSMKAVGTFFSKEVMYLSIIIFWGVLLLLEMLMKNLTLNRKLKVDTQKFLEITAKTATYKQQAETDKLTGILNRDGLTKVVDNLKSNQLLHQYALMVLDLDHFKAINDQHGHLVGDGVLQETVQTIKNNLRSYDTLARWGGEEFVILFYCMQSDSMEVFPEKIRKSIEATNFIGGKCSHLTASIGVTQIVKSELFENAFIRADKALYKAKENGRNQCVII